MQRPLLYLAALLLTVGAPAPLYALTDYYVATTGDDTTGNGSAGNPWRTITHALSQVITGDTVNVAAGTYDEANGEVFPFEVFAGISLIGAGRDLTHVVTDGQTGQVLLGSFGSTIPCSISGFDLQMTPTVSGAPTSLIGVEAEAGNVTIRNNRLRAPRRLIYGGQSAFYSLQISSNLATDVASHLEGDFLFGFVSAACQVRNNDVQGFEKGVYLGFGGPSLGSVRPQSVRIEGNRFSGMSATAIHLEGERPPEMLFIERNEIENIDATGLLIEHQVPGRTHNVEGYIRYNSIIDCGNAGMKFTLSAHISSGSSTSTTPHSGHLNFDVSIFGNVITDNGGRGISLKGDISFGGSTLQMPTFGTLRYPEWPDPALPTPSVDSDSQFAPSRKQSPPSSSRPKRPTVFGYAGRNMIKNNGAWEVYAYGDNTQAPFLLLGNWWGSTNPAVIRDHIWDVRDDPDQEVLVRAGNPLRGIMTVKLSSTEAPAVGGKRVVVAAKPGAAFVAAVGRTDIAVTLGGVPVDNLQLAESGLRLKFDTPALPPGPATLLIQNPNGTSATRTVQIVP